MATRKKAQGGSEYLIILGVIILIAGIISFSMSKQTGDFVSSSFWGLADISITSFSVSAGANEFNGRIGNNIGHSISSLAVTVGGVLLDCDDTILSAGRKTSCSGRAPCGGKGESYSLDVSISYIDDDSGTTKNYTGEGYRLEGKCVK